jgi:pilus assembly protein Flp/PilA
MEEATMSFVKQSLINFLKKEDGPTAVECALMLALIVVVCIVAINTVQSNPSAGEPTVIETVRQ